MICRNVANDHVRQTPGYHPNCRNFQNDRIHQDTDKSLLPSATKLGQGYVFTGVCDSVHRGACMVVGGVWGWGVRGCRGGAWLQGGMRGCQGVCVVAGGHVWLPGGVHDCWGGMHGCGGGCMVVGGGGMCGCWGVHGCRGGGMCGCRGDMHRIRRDTVNERTVRILLECILVITIIMVKVICVIYIM